MMNFLVSFISMLSGKSPLLNNHFTCPKDLQLNFTVIPIVVTWYSGTTIIPSEKKMALIYQKSDVSVCTQL